MTKPGERGEVQWAAQQEPQEPQHPPHRPEEGAPSLPAELDLRMPVFFLSYAHSEGRHVGPPQEPNRRFVRFFDDLSENAAQLIGRPTGSDPGFMDRSLAGGSRWTNDLLDALGGCQVFVALLSEPYLISEWCGMEWHAFSQRKVLQYKGDGGRHQSAIIPVIWAPLRYEQAPAAVRAVQRFSPAGLSDSAIKARYEANGIFGLLATGQDAAYQAVVWSLAQQIAHIHHTYWVEPREFAPGELDNIFQEQSS
jgi:hypothetical protein